MTINLDCSNLKILLSIVIFVLVYGVSNYESMLYISEDFNMPCSDIIVKINSFNQYIAHTCVNTKFSKNIIAKEHAVFEQSLHD